MNPHRYWVYSKNTIVVQTLEVRISMVFSYGGAEGEAVELNASPFNKRGFVGPILIQREPVPPRDFLLVVLRKPHAHDVN